jgi:hypothetical protein
MLLVEGSFKIGKLYKQMQQAAEIKKGITDYFLE